MEEKNQSITRDRQTQYVGGHIYSHTYKRRRWWRPLGQLRRTPEIVYDNELSSVSLALVLNVIEWGIIKMNGHCLAGVRYVWQLYISTWGQIAVLNQYLNVKSPDIGIDFMLFVISVTI